MNNADNVMCIAWFRRDQWFLLKQKVVDPEIIEDTYEEWEEEAEKLVQKFIALGKSIKNIDVDIFELEEWCKTNGLANDATARSQYAAQKGMEQDSLGF